MEAQKTFKMYSGKSFRLLQFSGLNNIRHNLLEDLVSQAVVELVRLVEK